MSHRPWESQIDHGFAGQAAGRVGTVPSTEVRAHEGPQVVEFPTMARADPDNIPPPFVA